MANKVQWESLIEDAVALRTKYDENDVAFIAIKYNLKPETAKIYINTAKRAERGQELKGNYNRQFLKALKDKGYLFTLREKKPEMKPQPTMGLMDYSVTGDIQSLHDEIDSLKKERDIYKRKYEGMVRSIDLIHRANPMVK